MHRCFEGVARELAAFYSVRPGHTAAALPPELRWGPLSLSLLQHLSTALLSLSLLTNFIIPPSHIPLSPPLPSLSLLPSLSPSHTARLSPARPDHRVRVRAAAAAGAGGHGLRPRDGPPQPQVIPIGPGPARPGPLDSAREPPSAPVSRQEWSGPGPGDSSRGRGAPLHRRRLGYVTRFGPYAPGRRLVGRRQPERLGYSPSRTACPGCTRPGCRPRSYRRGRRHRARDARA